ncbi:MAG: hypothetical protein QOI24_1724 [Acidobacteriota bacterium]|nr:hypothetical protein [Acidobacteriota bacterium]
MKRSAAALLVGAFVVGTLDLLFAIGFWLPKGVAPIRILQSIAAGVLGRASFTGGKQTAVLGGLLHYFIAFVIVLVYWLSAKRIEILQRKPILLGALYGIGVYLFMNYVVIPLSAAKPSRFNLVWVVASVIVHMFLIGVPAAIAARKALR